MAGDNPDVVLCVGWRSVAAFTLCLIEAPEEAQERECAKVLQKVVRMAGQVCVKQAEDSEGDSWQCVFCSNKFLRFKHSPCMLYVRSLPSFPENCDSE